MINKDEVKHIAGLARIGMTDEELSRMSKELSAILGFVEQLKEVDVASVEPTAHITGLENKSRVDKFKEFENTEGIKKLFPEEKNGYDKVKSVL